MENIGQCEECEAIFYMQAIFLLSWQCEECEANFNMYMVLQKKVCVRSVRLFYDKGGKLLKEIDGINVQQVIKVGLMILYHWSV